MKERVLWLMLGTFASGLFMGALLGFLAGICAALFVVGLIR